MKSFVIYLIVFFISASLIRGIFGIHSKADINRIYKNPYLEAKLKKKREEKEREAKKHPKTDQQISHSNSKATISTLEITGSDLKHIEKKYLKLGIYNNLSKKFSNIDPSIGNLRLVVTIDKQKFTPKIYTSIEEHKIIYHYDLDTQINAIYNLYNKYGKRLARDQVFVKRIIKGVSDENALESERLARKSLFATIGKKIADSLNRRTYILRK